MHTTEMLVGEDNEGFTIYHDGNYSGDVKIKLDPGRVEKIPAVPEEVALMVTIPFEVAASIVANTTRQSKIIRLQNATDREILGLPEPRLTV